jgi:parallel beta-helix repeat protein
VPGQRPIFDFAKATGVGISIESPWWHIKGITATHAESSGIRIQGIGAFRNILENCTARANENTGIHMGSGAADNTILNCDSYENFDARKHGQDADGFGAKFSIGTGNRCIGCRSWNNSDDGYDCWYAGSGVRFENCYAWANGVNIWKDPLFEGNGNGFKLGQLEGTHVLVNCVVWDQPHGGFDLNGNSSGVTITNCTAFRCGSDFAFTSSRGNIEKNVLRKNISFDGPNKIDPKVDDKDNSWNTPGLTLTRADFQSLDPNCMQGPRNPDGSLPKCNFLHLTPASKAKGLGVLN